MQKIQLNPNGTIDITVGEILALEMWGDFAKLGYVDPVEGEPDDCIITVESKDAEELGLYELLPEYEPDLEPELPTPYDQYNDELEYDVYGGNYSEE